MALMKKHDELQAQIKATYARIEKLKIGIDPFD